MAREILTLQFGHYSNFVGSHFWNIQELSFDYTGKVISEFNNDILYREGLTNNNIVTYTPRLLLSDLKGTLSTLPESGGLEQNYIDNDLSTDVEKIQQPLADKNNFLKNLDNAEIRTHDNVELENCINTWTDFLYPRFHHRTVNVVNTYEHNNDKNAFEIFPQGSNTWKSTYGEDFSDKIRQYVEECDNIQGFHVSFDSTDAFAGLAASCMEHIADEYSKSILAFPIINPHFPDNNPKTEEETVQSNNKDSTRLINLSLALEKTREFSSLFVPLCTAESGWRKPGKKRIFHNTNYKAELPYHTSAVLASALDTLSLRYRLRTGNYTLSDICADMSGYGRKMAAASLGLPFSMHEGEDLIDYLNKTEIPFYTTITPSCKLDTDKVCQLFTVRGVPETSLKRPAKDAKHQVNLAAYKCNSVKEMLQLYFEANCFLSLTDVAVVKTPLEIKSPYPDIFIKNMTRKGLIAEYEPEPIETAPVIAGFHNGEFLSNTLERMTREANRIKIKKFHKFKQEGVEESEFLECLNSIEEFKQNYDDNHEL